MDKANSQVMNEENQTPTHENQLMLSAASGQKI